MATVRADGARGREPECVYREGGLNGALQGVFGWTRRLAFGYVGPNLGCLVSKLAHITQAPAGHPYTWS